MTADDPRIRALREAVRLAPGDVGLRRLLADSLVARDRLAEAETELREALRLTPQDAELKLALARVFQQQGKASAAQVVLEDLIGSAPAARGAPGAARTLAEAHLLHARVLLGVGETARAVEEYRAAQRLDPHVADADLAGRLGVGVGERSTSPVVEGRARAAAGGTGGEVTGDQLFGDTPVAPAAERARVTFADVGGMEELKHEIRMKIVHPLEHPELYRAYGKPVGGAILMYGPPGCGKTHLARATAGEAGADFLTVGLDEILDMWIGSSERNLHEVFERARFRKPCVLFFDEVDALGARRTDMRSASNRHVINQFLSELDGVKTSNEGILVLAATNAPWHLDSAFRRPGRFDRVLFVPPPDQPARAAILRILCRDKPAEAIDFDLVAARTGGFSGADLKAVVDRCVEDKLREAMRVGAVRPLTTRDLTSAVKAVKPSTREWFATARNYALHANEGGIYDDVLHYLERR
jgi:transitional endoplasmic reticulum ATPase